MTKYDLLKALEHFDNHSLVYFTENVRDVLEIDDEAAEVFKALEIKEGDRKSIVLIG